MTHEVRTDHVIAATGFAIDRLDYREFIFRSGIARRHSVLATFRRKNDAPFSSDFASRARDFLHERT
jgi:hypothetical protein